MNGPRGNKTQSIHQRIAELEARLAQIPSRFGAGAKADKRLAIQIIGGQVVSGVDCITYASAVTAGAVYNPDTDSVYPSGLGRGWLWVNGARTKRVLVRHTLSGFPYPVQAGRIWRVAGTETMSYDPGTGPVTMTAYLFDLG